MPSWVDTSTIQEATISAAGHEDYLSTCELIRLIIPSPVIRLPLELKIPAFQLYAFSQVQPLKDASTTVHAT